MATYVGVTNTLLPGLQKPVIYGIPSGVWTVSEDNAFGPFGGDFPTSWLFDQFVLEAASGRVLGTSNLRGVYAFDRRSGQFRLIVPILHSYKSENETGIRFVQTIARIERLGLTLIGTDKGVFELQGEKVQPLPGASAREIGPVVTIIDLPVHRGIVLAGYHSARFRNDDGTMEMLAYTGAGLFCGSEQITHAMESKQPGRIVLESQSGGAILCSGKSRLREIEMWSSPEGFVPGAREC